MQPLIVVPFHDPRWLARARKNVIRQEMPLPSLLVCNGAARGLASDFSYVTESRASHADAVNTGVTWAREHGFSHVVLFDSDDYYGPRYTSKVLDALGRADFCGQRQVFTQFRDGAVHLLERPGRCFVFATVGFAVNKFLPVAADLLDNCHDWSARMAASGCSSIDTGPRYYCYSRHGQNAHWDGRIPDTCVRLAWGPSRLFDGSHTVCDAPERYAGRDMPVPTPSEVLASLA